MSQPVILIADAGSLITLAYADAKAQFILPDHCQKVSTRAFLLFLEQQGLIDSAQDLERKALQAGRAFSRLRFPLEFPK